MPNDHKQKSWLLAKGIVKFEIYYHNLMILLINHGFVGAKN